MRAVVSASRGRFTVDAQSDPVAFTQWLAHALHRETAPRGKGGASGSSVVDDCFAGEMEIVEVGEAPPAGNSGGSGATVAKTPFRTLALDLPPPPLFQDAMEKNGIPQVSIAELLKKYDGVTPTPTPRGGSRTHRLTKLPPYLIVHHKRFTKNAFFNEKNPTIVTFPTKTLLRLADHVPVPSEVDESGARRNVPSSYALVANVCHDGRPEDGTYRCQVFHRADGNWYDTRDLAVDEVLPQQVALTETYLQIWERRDEDRGEVAGGFGKTPGEGAFGVSGDAGEDDDAMET
jgi:U4/U6.U5 tri-snRNP-associated protein 2